MMMQSLVLLLSALELCRGNLVLTRESRERREVGPMMKGQKKYRRLQHSIMVQTDIRSRYASTLVTSTVENTEDAAREVFFNVILPQTAFISRFAMEVEGIYYIGQVKQKEQAWRMYKEAVQRNQTAGHIDVEARHSNRFRVSVNTEAHTMVKFFLVHEELLALRNGLYEYTVNIMPHLKLSSYSVGISITETTNITQIDVNRLSFRKQVTEGGNATDAAAAEEDEEQLAGAEILMSPTNPGKVTVNYKPDIRLLEQDLRREKHPLQLVVEYQVDRSQGDGNIELLDGYFVHFTAPENLVPMAKHVVFVLDTSGSMRHRKMHQTISAMVTILGEMRSQDYITIISFATNITVWSDGETNILQATNHNLSRAIRYVESLEAGGETNINGALLEAMDILTEVKTRAIMKEVQSMVFFLTDGHPTVGVTDTLEILDNIRRANTLLSAPIFSLAFGRRTDFNMLRLLSVQNNGFARKIYTAADASLQMEGFYKEVSSPILSNVTFDYLDSSIITESLTDTAFHTFYQGGEMVVAGMIDTEVEVPVIEYKVTAHQTSGDYSLSGLGATTIETVDTYIDLLPTFNISEYNYMERLWAYLSVHSLLRKVERGQLYSCQPKPEPEFSYQEGGGGFPQPIICNNLERALMLSLKYQFVTPLTSLVVIKPDIIEDGDIQEADMFNRKIRVVSASPESVSHWWRIILLMHSVSLLIKALT